jgi:hypothetical protein
LGFPLVLARALDRLSAPAELAVGAVLVSGIGGLAGVLVGSALAFAFLILHLRARALGVVDECGCVGAAGTAPDPVLALIRATIVAALGLAAVGSHAFGASTGHSPDGIAQTAVGFSVGVTIFLVLALFGAIRDFNSWRHLVPHTGALSAARESR